MIMNTNSRYSSGFLWLFVALAAATHAATGFVVGPLSSRHHRIGSSSTLSNTRLYYYFCDPQDGENNNNNNNFHNPMNNENKKKRKKWILNPNIDGMQQPQQDDDPLIAMELQELENARSAFEELMASSRSTTVSTSSSSSSSRSTGGVITVAGAGSVAAPPPTVALLTSAGRRKRQLEMQLLASLATSDDAVDALVQLWTTEQCDAQASHDILALQNSNAPCSAGLVQEQAQLQAMSRHYPGWAEPIARLTSVLFHQGRVAQAVDLAEIVLQLKPWHFEVCTLLNNVQQNNNNNELFVNDRTRAKAHYLARHSLPPLENVQERQRWVDWALAEAAQQLAQAEAATSALQQENDACSAFHMAYHHGLSADDIWQ